MIIPNNVQFDGKYAYIPLESESGFDEVSHAYETLVETFKPFVVEKPTITVYKGALLVRIPVNTDVQTLRQKTLQWEKWIDDNSTYGNVGVADLVKRLREQGIPVKNPYAT